jgi:hypothetical protein
MKKLFLVLAALSFAACTHEVKKPDTNWKVKAGTESEKTIWVTRPDGSAQCDKRKVATPEQVAHQVKGAGVLVFKSRSGNDGQMHAQRCGSPTGRTVDLEISRVDLKKALALGFVPRGSED